VKNVCKDYRGRRRGGENGRREGGKKSLYTDILYFIQAIPILWAAGPAVFFKFFFSQFMYIILSNGY
jgi:hypothetical protein